MKAPEQIPKTRAIPVPNCGSVAATTVSRTPKSPASRRRIPKIRYRLFRFIAAPQFTRPPHFAQNVGVPSILAPQNSQNFADFLGGAIVATGGAGTAPGGIVTVGIGDVPTSLNVSAILRYSLSFCLATAWSTSSWTRFRVAPGARTPAETMV